MNTNQTDKATSRRKPTPTPWGFYRGGLKLNYYITGSLPGAKNVLQVATLTNITGGMTESNAELIVQAVNQYEALRAVAEAAKEFIKSDGPQPVGTNQQRFDALVKALKQFTP